MLMVKPDLHRYAQGMAFKYRWLNQALDDMDQEICYVRYEFGENTARKVESRIHERVINLCAFPYLGMNYEGLKHQGNAVRILHIKQISLIYSIDGNMITLIALWNNRRDEKMLKSMIDSRQ